ncbi:MAG: hypothetical protein VB111_03130 [Clostridiaceae bacterium]|nr:hypothetical protein [Clostridiaceae bacterium]
MASYTTTSCPHCGRVDKFLTPRSDYTFGSMLRTCPKCQKQYIDKTYIELALVDNQKYKPVRSGVGAIGFLFIALFCGYCCIYTAYVSYFSIAIISSNGDSLLFWGTAIAAIVSLLVWISDLVDRRKNYSKYYNEYMRELRSSQERMKDENYLRMLKQAGIKVPYLIRNK